MISALFSRLIVLTFGTLYPAYASYKAVRTKCVKEYVKWMMYWIVFAFFTFIETFTDLLLSWFPFYYEVKIVIVFWLLSPATKGSSTLYRNFVHPMLTRREQEIDDYINQAKERGYSTVLQLGSKGVNYATNVIMQTAIKTIQLASTNSGLPPTRPLTSSQSATTISSYGRLARDATDETDLLSTGDRMGTVRSSSLHNFATHMEFSEEDEAPVYYATNVDNVELLEEDEDMVALSELVAQSDVGAARTRKGRPRKVNSTGTITEVKRSTGSRTASKNVGTSTTTGVRGRRKLREPTPDMDIDIE